MLRSMKRERKRVFCFRDLKLKKNDARSLSLYMRGGGACVSVVPAPLASVEGLSVLQGLRRGRRSWERT